tara:strand:- start:14595 stop:14906 length:312 start_codon:yes stop_codon:yes gene_type:complete
MKDTIYTEEELEGKHTKQVMSILNDVRAYRGQTEQSHNYASARVEELIESLEYSKNILTSVKNDMEEYDAYLVTIKKVLSTREHIPNKKEAKKIRQDAAKNGR